MKVAFVNGAVFTPEAIRGKAEPAEAVLVEGRRVVAVGSNDEIRAALTPGDESVDLQGNHLYPGFHDAHTHLGSYGTSLRQLSLEGAPTLAKALEKVAAYTKTLQPGEWLVARRWDESRWPENRYISRAELDPITPNNPALLLRVDGHMGVFNSLALRALGIRESDAPDGILKETALDSARVRIQPSVAERKQDILRAIEKAHELGVTAIGEIATREDFHAYLDLWKSGQLKLRINLIPIWEIWDAVTLTLDPIKEKGDSSTSLGMTNGSAGPSVISSERSESRNLPPSVIPSEHSSQPVIPSEPAPNVISSDRRESRNLPLPNYGDDTLTLHSIKFFADGSIGARTALLSEDYADTPGVRGQPYLDLPELEEGIRTVVKAGFQPVTHAIGDAAIERVLSVYSRVANREPRVAALRPRIEHFEMPTTEHIERLKTLGGIASMQPNFIGEWGLPGAMYEQRLGLARREAMNPLWEIQHRGLPLCFGSDMMPFSPLYGIRCALMSPVRRQQLKERDAVLAYTEGGAYAAFMEHAWGKIAPGFCADFVVLDDSPAEMANILMTVFNGTVVYRKGL